VIAEQNSADSQRAGRNTSIVPACNLLTEVRRQDGFQVCLINVEAKGGPS
jgi:hypothetical protein